MILPDTVPDRRVDLDWLRIAAFGLLIFYHVGMFYVTWDFHVKSSRAGEGIEPLMLLLNPWRLLLLFVISGVATRFMADKISSGRFLGARTARLIVPLVFGMFVIVPPQTYFQIVETLGYSGSFADFYGKYATASGDWRPGGEALVTPTWNHLWFVAYLFVFTLLIAAVGPMVKRLPARFVSPLISGPGLFLAPWLFLWICRVILFPIFGDTHALFGDWYVLTENFAGFLFGYAVAKYEPFFAACERNRLLALGLAIAAWAGMQYVNSLKLDLTPFDPAIIGVRGIRQLQAWCAIIACVGFARRYMRKDSPVRRYLTDAIFPFYVIHQTTIVVAGHYLDDLAWPLWIEAPVLIALTAGSCWLGYEIVRRVGFLRPLFGLKMESRAKKTAAPQPA